jgi:hypothetical protein
MTQQAQKPQPVAARPMSSDKPFAATMTIRFHTPIVLGGQQRDYVEVRKGGMWSLELDWMRRVVWVYVQLNDKGRFAKGWVPFENVRWGECAQEFIGDEVAAKAAPIAVEASGA